RKMQELAQQNIPYTREFLPRDEGLQKFRGEGDFMKCHYIEQFTKPDEKISIYKTGNFLDFCRGPHIPSTGTIKAFKLLNIAGAYLLASQGRDHPQRDGRLDARPVPEARLLASLHAACGATTVVADLRA